MSNFDIIIYKIFHSIYKNFIKCRCYDCIILRINEDEEKRGSYMMPKIEKNNYSQFL